jgi:transcriptional regulator with XRE-family HTH domain
VEQTSPPIGQRLRDMRLAKELTQEQAGKLCGVSAATICEIEKADAGRRLPPSATKYAEALGFELIQSVVVVHELKKLSRRGGRADVAAA